MVSNFVFFEYDTNKLFFDKSKKYNKLGKQEKMFLICCCNKKELLLIFLLCPLMTLLSLSLDIYIILNEKKL